MIIKRIRKYARRQRRSFQHIAALVNALTAYAVDLDSKSLLALAEQSRAASYVLDARSAAEFGIEPGEKVAEHGSRNLIGGNLVQHQQQMLAACLLAPAAADPIEHYVVSWRAGEMPSAVQIEQVIDVFAEVMGYTNCQIVWATHSNTSNYHLHLVVNRVDLIDRRVVSPGEGWEIDRLHQVIALVEERQGWSSEPGAIYFAQDGAVYDQSTKQIVRRADGSRDGCHVRDAKPPEKGQVAQYQGIVAAMRSAGSWRELHCLLGANDAVYATKGSGAEICVGRERMRASDFGREFTFKKMVAKLGPYEADVTQARDPHELYRAALRVERERVRVGRNAALEELRRRRRLALEQAAQQRHNDVQQAIDDERLQLSFVRVEAEIRLAFDMARRTIAASYLDRDRWYKSGQPGAVRVTLPQMIWGGENPHDRAIVEQHGFRAEQNELCVEYLDHAGARVISDYGLLLLVHRLESDAIKAAMALVSIRADWIMVSGSPAFCEECRKEAISRGYNLVLEDGTVIARATSTPKEPEGKREPPLQNSRLVRNRYEQTREVVPSRTAEQPRAQPPAQAIAPPQTSLAAMPKNSLLPPSSTEDPALDLPLGLWGVGRKGRDGR